MKRDLFLSLLAAATLFACSGEDAPASSGALGDSSSDVSSGTGSGAGSATNGASTGASTSGAGGASSSSGAGGSVPAVPSCFETCAMPSDCAIAGAPLYDASHYSCDSGLCAWQGCKSTAECTQAFMSPDYVCDTLAGVPFPTCNKACSTPADCAVPGAKLYDASHYACTSGVCEWQGCQTTSDCTETLMNNAYLCTTLPGYDLPNCYPTCDVPDDCAIPGSPLYAGSHYSCDDHLCHWLGCQSPEECKATFNNPDYTCE